MCALGPEGESEAKPRATRRAEAATAGNGAGGHAESTNHDPHRRRGEGIRRVRHDGLRRHLSGLPRQALPDWKLDDPADQGVEAVRPIRDQIKTVVVDLITRIAPAKPEATA